MDSHRILATQVILGIEIGDSLPLPIVIEYRADHWLRIEVAIFVVQSWLVDSPIVSLSLVRWLMEKQR